MIPNASSEQEQKTWYQSYYKRQGADRNNPRLNPGATLQILAAEAALIRAFRHIPHSPEKNQLLDVGCGSGARIFEFFRLGFRPLDVIGIDLQEERLNAAREFLPQLNLLRCDASAMDFETQSFDFVFESTMFATLPDPGLRLRIAQEMVRVCRSGGYLLLSDWRIPKYGDRTYKALTKRDLCQLFAVGKETQLIAIENGALIPPVGRFLSAHVSSLYFLVAAFLPFFVGQVVYVLRKM